VRSSAPTAGEAAARLRYVADLRVRTRRAALLPSPGLLVPIGAVLVAHALVLALWPHGGVATVVWIAAFLAARPALQAEWRRARRAPGLVAAARSWTACVAAVGLGLVVAAALGLDALITAVAAAFVARAALARRPVVALAAVAAAAGAAALVAAGVPAAALEAALGAALVAAGWALA
jgi:hypothetical protein